MTTHAPIISYTIVLFIMLAVVTGMEGDIFSVTKIAFVGIAIIMYMYVVNSFSY